MQQSMYVCVLKIYLNVQNIVFRKSRTLEDCDTQNIYWCFIYITVIFGGVVMTIKQIDEIW